MKIKATVAVLTFNSGETLERTLKSVNNFDDILICDGGSTDNTLDIAQSFGARVITQDSKCKNLDGTLADFSCIRNQSLEEAGYDWFLYLDSDESVDEDLIREIEKVTLNSGESLVYNISPRIIYDGKIIEYSSNYPGWQKRFFNKKSGAVFIKPVHERIDFDQKKITEGYLDGHWYYFVDKNFSLHKLKKYSLMEAELAHENKSRTIFSQIFQRFVIILKIFIKSCMNYLFHGFKKTLPPKAEFRRIYYNLMTVYYLLWNKTK